MRRLREAIRQKRPGLWANNSWILHYDNAPSHNAIIIREHLDKKKRIPSNNHRIYQIWLPATFSYSVDSSNRIMTNKLVFLNLKIKS